MYVWNWMKPTQVFMNNRASEKGNLLSVLKLSIIIKI